MEPLVSLPDEEIEDVTPEMIEAGAYAIGLLFGEGGVSRAPLRMAAEDCYLAMREIYSKQMVENALLGSNIRTRPAACRCSHRERC